MSTVASQREIILLAIVSPGQGSQSVGMLQPWLNDQQNLDLLNTWSQSIGIELSQLGQYGSAEDIKSTEIAQLLIFSCSILSSLGLNIETFKKQKVIFAGHSVGEFAAYALAGVFNFSDAIKLVSARGKAMKAAAEIAPQTGMSAVLGGNKDFVISFLKEHDLTPANINSEGQIIAAGKIDKLEELKLNPPTGTKVIPLNVDAAFHTSYMRPAISEFKEVFNDIEIRFPEQLILTNKNGEFVKEKSDIVENLVNQIISPVRWDLCQKQFISNGVTGMLELSPGGTLSGIAKKGAPGIETCALKTPKDIDIAKEFIRKHIEY